MSAEELYYRLREVAEDYLAEIGYDELPESADDAIADAANEVMSCVTYEWEVHVDVSYPKPYQIMITMEARDRAEIEAKLPTLFQHHYWTVANYKQKEAV